MRPRCTHSAWRAPAEGELGVGVRLPMLRCLDSGAPPRPGPQLSRLLLFRRAASVALGARPDMPASSSSRVMKPSPFLSSWSNRPSVANGIWGELSAESVVGSERPSLESSAQVVDSCPSPGGSNFSLLLKASAPAAAAVEVEFVCLLMSQLFSAATSAAPAFLLLFSSPTTSSSLR